MAHVENLEALLHQLEEKLGQELREQHVYEALQYVQSFIARKKKILGVRGTSTAVFLSAKTLLSGVNYDSAESTTASLTLAATAGTLLKWFIEEGAGLDYQFRLYPDQLNSVQYCDVQNLQEFLSALDIRTAGPVVDAIYNPLHVLVAKSKVKKHSHLSQRITKLEVFFAGVLQNSKRWLSAFKSYIRLQNAEKAAEVLNQWSAEGYATEKAIFFGRGLLYLLSENKAVLAKELLHASLQYIEDNTGADKVAGGPSSTALAVWHVAVILTDLANFPPMPRVDKTKLFGLLHRRYGAFFVQVDVKLLEVFLKAGEACFNYVLENPADNTPSPMAMLQSLLTGGASNKPTGNGRPNRPSPTGGLDIEALMSMMNKMHGKS